MILLKKGGIKLKKGLSLILLLVIFLAPAVSADRGSIPFIQDIDIFEPNQDALIAWNGEEEILILSTKLYSSQPTKVLQVLPLPSEPEVKKSSRDILRRANELIFKNLFNELRLPVLRNSNPKVPAAEIKEEVVIGSHDILVLKVLNQNDFVDWVNNYLQEKGQKNPQIPLSLQKTINNYIKKGYNYFVFDTIEVGPEPKTNEAISYQFKSKELYYPLEITKSDHGQSEISLLILTNKNLVNYQGLAQNRIKTKNSALNLSPEQLDYISPVFVNFFSQNIESEVIEPQVKLLSWSIKDDLANFDQDLIVDHQIENLLKNQFNYKGRTYVDFKEVENYPFSTPEKLTTLSGQVEMRMGSRMFPWLAASIEGKVLFNAQTKKLISNFADQGQYHRVRGYYRPEAEIGMRDPIDSMPAMVKIKNVFYVTEIKGWKPYSGLALRSNGSISNTRTYLWLKED